MAVERNQSFRSLPSGKYQPSDDMSDYETMAPVKSLSTPLRNGMTPPRNGMTTSRNGMTPPRNGMTTSRNGMTPPRNGMTPPRNGMTPPRNGVPPPRNGMTPPRNGMTTVQYQTDAWHYSQVQDSLINGMKAMRHPTLSCPIPWYSGMGLTLGIEM